MPADAHKPDAASVDLEIIRTLRPAYTLVRNDDGDWIGLYGPDGRLIEEGHSFSESRVLELAGVAHDVVYDVDLSELGRLPSTLGGSRGAAASVQAAEEGAAVNAATRCRS